MYSRTTRYLPRYLQGRHRHKAFRGPIDPDRVPQWPAEHVERDDHDVPVLEPQAVAEAEDVGAEEVDVNVTLAAVDVVLEVVVLEVGQGVAHVGLAATDVGAPDGLAG